jgi:ABC-type multidrug transport system fused ATPase/permease subunit
MALRNEGKTVILPCHALSFLRFADQIISLKDNRIDEQGSFRSLLSNQGDFASLMEIHSSTNADDEDAQGAQDKKDADAAENAGAGDDKEPDAKAPATPVGDKNKGKIIKDEERAKGTVDKSVYQFYMRQVGVSSVIYVMFCFVMGQLLQTFSDWWMSRWAIRDVGLIPNEAEGWSDREVIAWFLGIYATSGVAIVIFTVCKTMIIQLIGFTAARKIHQKLLWRLMKAPVRYFDVTPVGRIVNRFSSDMSDIDNQISQNFMYLLR